MPTLERRKLTFATLDEVVADAENLLAKGYDKAGNWDLAQVCGHLAEWMRYQIDGYPQPPLLLRPVFWLVRNTVGKGMAKKMLTGGTMKTGLRTIPQSIPAAGTDDAAGVAKLRDAIARWKVYTGPLHASPLFGALPRDEWTKGHLIHCAHHLSFLVPRG